METYMPNINRMGQEVMKKTKQWNVTELSKTQSQRLTRESSQNVIGMGKRRTGHCSHNVAHRCKHSYVFENGSTDEK